MNEIILVRVQGTQDTCRIFSGPVFEGSLKVVEFAAYDKLQKELDRCKKYHGQSLDNEERLLNRAKAAEEKLAAITGLLELYGEHPTHCAAWYEIDDIQACKLFPDKCDCGITDALKP